MVLDIFETCQLNPAFQPTRASSANYVLRKCLPLRFAQRSSTHAHLGRRALREFRLQEWCAEAGIVQDAFMLVLGEAVEGRGDEPDTESNDMLEGEFSEGDSDDSGDSQASEGSGLEEETEATAGPSVRS